MLYCSLATPPIATPVPALEGIEKDMEHSVNNLECKHRHDWGQIKHAGDRRNDAPYGLKHRDGNQGEQLHQRVTWIRAEPRENHVEKEYEDKEPRQIHDDSQT